jgi:hypothetical protein
MASKYMQVSHLIDQEYEITKDYLVKGRHNHNQAEEQHAI